MDRRAEREMRQTKKQPGRQTDGPAHEGERERRAGGRSRLTIHERRSGFPGPPSADQIGPGSSKCPSWIARKADRRCLRSFFRAERVKGCRDASRFGHLTEGARALVEHGDPGNTKGGVSSTHRVR